MYLDIFIAIPLLWGMFRGFRRGLIIELCTLMALILGVYGAATFGDMGGSYIESEFHTDPRLSHVLAFSIIFILIVVVVFIFGKVLEGLIKMVALGLVNKIFGMLFGSLKFALILSGVLYMLNGFPLTDNLISNKSKNDSYLYSPIQGLAPKLFPILKNQTWLNDVRDRYDDLKNGVEKSN